MRHTLVILLGCLRVMSAQAQPEKVVRTTWVDGTSATSGLNLMEG